ncbi:MAG TPA: hypothetical protein PK224_03860 [Nitrospira sp.]|nr:hypothetical protein [Nitrospira sp.]
MIQQRNAEQISSVAQPFGQNAIFWARGGIAGGVIMAACDVKSL